MRDFKQFIYEAGMVLLATLSVATIWNTTPYNSFIIWVTWGIFFTDFIYRFYKSENKWNFIKSNPFLVIAIIPLDAIFQLARFARILHLLRLKTITKYYTKPFIQFLKRQHISVVFSIPFLVMFLSVIPLYKWEPEIVSYREAFISSIVALVFFGQTDFEPTTMPGHIIIVLLTVLGVVFHGLIISAAVDVIFQSDWFQTCKQKIKKEKDAE
ncbi:hypothetical protein [Aquibacillus sediminis]|uniref:hypothetical protein n=1 Tax=Aquibacillus sediminis TaxID=2574734 RepID=UPI0011083128|nr:hypothetical protein [Aquibacillus sediminis]